MFVLSHIQSKPVITLLKKIKDYVKLMIVFHNKYPEN